MPNKNYNEPDNELDMFEAFAAQIFGSTFSVMQDVLQGGTGHIMINDDQATAGPPTWDDGSDFRKLAKTKRNNNQATSKAGEDEVTDSDRSSRSLRGPLNQQDQFFLPVLSNSQQQPSSILDLLFKSHPAFQSEDDSMIFGNGQSGGSNWSFTSSSSRTTLLPDGSEETITTKSVNGVTETVKRIKNPDGSIMEIVEPSKKPLHWTAPLQSLEDKVSKVWEDSRPELDQSMAELDRAATSIAKAYSGIRDGMFSKLWNTFTGAGQSYNDNDGKPSKET